MPCQQCPHGRRRDLCKQCGGNGFCQHGNQKQKCLPCGTGLCPLHPTMLKVNCKVCQKCIHGKWKRNCKMCTKPRSIGFGPPGVAKKAAKPKRPRAAGAAAPSAVGAQVRRVRLARCTTDRAHLPLCCVLIVTLHRAAVSPYAAACRRWAPSSRACASRVGH
jgi:hypothetical protein